MSEFKVGDRVKYIGSKRPELAGSVGVIVDIVSKSCCPIRVNFQETTRSWACWACLLSSLELVEMNKNGANYES